MPSAVPASSLLLIRIRWSVGMTMAVFGLIVIGAVWIGACDQVMPTPSRVTAAHAVRTSVFISYPLKIGDSLSCESHALAQERGRALPKKTLQSPSLQK